MAWAPDYVSLAELKAYLRLDALDTQDDDELALDIAAASRAIDQHTNRQFGKTSAPETRTYTSAAGEVWYDCTRGAWVVEIDDLMSTTGIVVEVPDVGTVTDYTLEPRNAVAKGRPYTRLVIAAGTSVQPGRVYPYEAVVEVTVNVWGWTATPDAIQRAGRLQAARLANRRDSPYGVAGSPSSGTELRLLAKVDPDVAVALKGYIRPRRTG